MVRKFNANISITYLLLGLLTSTNVIYIFKAGNTYFSGLSLLAILIIINYFIIKRKAISVNIIDKPIIIYFVISVLSIILIFYYSFTFPDLFSKYIKGLIILLMNLAIYIAVIIKPNQKMTIIKGIKIGFVANVFFALYQYIAIKQGLTFTNLSSIFPQGDYGKELVFFPVISGFFLEPAHMLRFFCGACILMMIKWEKSFVQFIMLGLTVFVLLVSTSSLVIVLAAGIIFCYIVIKTKKLTGTLELKKAKHLRPLKIVCVLFTIIILIFVCLFFKWQSYIEEFDFSWYWKMISEGANLTDIYANTQRITAITNALSLIPKYPFGIGLNGSAALMAYHFYGADVVIGATFNGLITIMLELGIFGLLSFLAIYINNFRMLVIKGQSKYKICLGCALIFATISTIMEGYTSTELMWVLLGLCSIETHANIK